MTSFRMRRWPFVILAMFLLNHVLVMAQDEETNRRIDAVMAAAEPLVLQQVDSPDGAWQAVVTQYPCIYIDDVGERLSYERLDIVDSSSDTVLLVAEQIINCQGLGAYGLAVRHWSGSGAYLYFTDAREGQPDGMASAWTPPIARYVVETASIEHLGQAALSMDGQWMATWAEDGIRLLATDSTEPNLYELMPADLQVIQVVWLPDSSGLIYVQADVAMGSVGRSTATHLDIATETQTILLDKR